MKRILLTIGIGSFALAVTTWGAQQSYNPGKRAQRTATVQSSAPRSYSRSINSVNRGSTTRSFSANQFRQRTNNVARLNSSNAVIHRNTVRPARIQTSQNFSANNARLRARNNVTVNRQFNRNRALNVNPGRNVAINREFNRNRQLNVKPGTNVGVNRARNLNRNFNINRRGNANIVNNWRGARFNGQKYAAFRNYNRQWHNRGWWHSHCSRIIFISGGWWAWNAGYWYPAWGYDPYYTYYPYDGPIYTGAADLSPDQVIVNVQQQLQSDGYYTGPIDGLLGPMTRSAIANYQADHGLAVTSAVDEPTLSTMGLV
jgi:hypothetical protein